MAPELAQLLSEILLHLHTAATEEKARGAVTQGLRLLDSFVPISPSGLAEASLLRSLVDTHLRLRLARIGQPPVSPSAHRATRASQKRGRDSAPLDRLTPREMEVLGWLAAGKQDAAIASIIGVSVRTANKHVEHILRKLHAPTRLAAVRIARAAGLRSQAGADAGKFA